MQDRIEKLLNKLKIVTELVIPASYDKNTTEEILIIDLCEKAISERFKQLLMGVEVDKKLKVVTYRATAFLLTEYEVRALIRYAKMLH